MSKRIAAFLGLDVSTKTLTAIVRNKGGEMDLCSVEMIGECQWEGEPAFDLDKLPALMIKVLREFESRGWVFSCGGTLVLSVRQHGTLLLDDGGKMLTFEVSWESSAAGREADRLNSSRAVRLQVGSVAPRYAVPKSAWMLKRQPLLRDQVRRVVLTGDLLCWWLTGSFRQAVSDGACNGICTITGPIAESVITEAGLEPTWFSKPIHSGEVVGLVRPNRKGPTGCEKVVRILNGWQVGAPLADNDASATGCCLFDDSTLVQSFGTSGTGMRLAAIDTDIREDVDLFVHFGRRLILKMLGRCARWYDEFRRRFAPDLDHAALDRLAIDANQGQLLRVCQHADMEIYPTGWAELGLGEKVASVQASIAVEMLRRARILLAAVEAVATPIGSCVLTGGLSKSPYLRHVFHAGMKMTAPDVDVKLMSFPKREEEFSQQTAAFGALMTAMSIASGTDIADLANSLCSSTIYRAPCESVPPERFLLEHLRASNLGK